LERYGKETGKQSTLIIDPSYYAEVKSLGQELAADYVSTHMD